MGTAAILLGRAYCCIEIRGGRDWLISEEVVPVGRAFSETNNVTTLGHTKTKFLERWLPFELSLRCRASRTACARHLHQIRVDRGIKSSQE